MARKEMTIEQIRQMVADGDDRPDLDEVGIYGLVDVDDMGWCDGGRTRWYTFDDYDGNPCVYYKYGRQPEYWNSDETY